MFPEDYYENLAEAFSERLTGINKRLLRSIGEGIKRVGYLNPSGVNTIKEMQRAGAESDKIIKEISEAAGEGSAFTKGILEKAAKESYVDTEDFFNFRGKKQIPYKDNKRLQGFVKSALKTTNGTFENLSETTVMTILGPDNEPVTLPFKEAYKEIIDRAITTSQLGYSSFDAEMKNILKQCGRSGLRVQYESGRTRRLDTAVRYNILDGLRQVQQDVRDEIGEEFEADGIELTAHSNCAKDHEDIQGKQFTKEEFERLNSRLKRPIGKHNCRHRAYSIILGVSKPAYSDEELEDFKKKNNKKITFEGKELTKYEATQLQRKLETEMRYTADEMEIAKASDNKELIGAMKNKSQWISRKYKELSETADIPMQKDRMWIYRKDGKMVDEVIEEGLTSAGGDDIIEATDLEYMSHSFRPVLGEESAIKVSKTGEHIKVKVIKNSSFEMYTDSDYGDKNFAVRLAEKYLNIVKDRLPEKLSMPKIAVVDFDKYKKFDKLAIGGYDEGSRALFLNSKYKRKKDIIEFVNREKGYFANNTEFALYLHELGHYVYYRYIEMLAEKKGISIERATLVIERVICEYVKEKREIDEVFLAKTISIYAESGYNEGNYGEVYAECFSVENNNQIARDICKLCKGVVEYEVAE